MLFIPNENLDPSFNLALEQHILTEMNLNEETLYFFIDRPSIIIGRHQNTVDEVNLDFVNDENIQIVRRLSGGGAVYHDLGNLCYSFIFPFPDQPIPDFSTFTEPVVRALRKLGVPAEKSGRNDILVEGAKISGTAYYHNKFGTVCHGTLLFDTDLTVLSRALNPKPEKLKSKGVQSVRSRVTNLKPYLPNVADTVTFRNILIDEIGQNARTVELNDADIRSAEAIADARYRNPDWIFGKSPKYNLRRTERFPFGEIDLRLEVVDNRIRDVFFYGDFFTSLEIDPIADALRDAPFTAAGVTNALTKINLGAFFPTLSVDDFVRFIGCEE